ncbi:hypothetical protein [Gibbsiella quercinecans]|uniref:hypothetical protein n=1 Tax=Gibbsiella quercinecans TaxID=929813 RepID=UPI0011C3EA65|nr:hypothetical protein [Gibbsiella quercinecans]
MLTLQQQLVRYAARYTLLLESHATSLPWETVRNIFITHQCAATELALAGRGWKLHITVDGASGFPMYLAVNKYGRKKSIRYEDYHREMARIR